jgi:hypothetical protein
MLKFRIEQAVNGFILHINRGDEYLGRYIYPAIEEVFSHILEELNISEELNNG